MGKFIVLEGIEGVGKTTNMEFICQYLKQNKINIIATREPGGTPLAEQMRDIVLHTQSDEPLNSDSELLLMFAARAQHLAQVIKPALNRGEWVISDRFTDASYAYQGGGRQIGMDRIAILENWVQGSLQPDQVIILDAPVDLALARTKKRKNRDRIEQETTEFFTRVRNIYLQRAKQDPKRYAIVNAAEALKTVQKNIAHVLDALIVESEQLHA